MSVNIKQRRSELKLTLEQIGNYVGVSKSTVKKWETGNIKNMRRDKIILLSQILRVSPLDFLEFPFSEQPSPPITKELRSLSSDTVKKIETAIGSPLTDWTLIHKKNNTCYIYFCSKEQISDAPDINCILDK